MVENNKKPSSFYRLKICRFIGAKGLSVKLNIFFFLFVGAASMACSGEKPKVPVGDFVRAIGNQVYLVNFEKNKDELFYSFPVGTVIEGGMSQIDERTILLSPQGAGIVTVDLISKDVKNIGKGMNPVYMDKHQKIVYYGRDKNGKGALLIANEKLEHPQRIVESNRHDIPKVVKISSEEIVFQRGELISGSDKWQSKVWKYNIVSKELVKLDTIVDCRLVNVWRSKTNQLICEKNTFDRFDTYYYLVDLLGKNETRIDIDGYLNVGEYIEDIDSIIIQKVNVKGGVEGYDLWLYDISNNSEHIIMENSGFAIDSFLHLNSN